MKQKLILIYLLFMLLSISLSIGVVSDEIKYKEGSKVLTQTMANQMIKDNDGVLVAMKDDVVPKDYPYFVGYNNATHKAMYANKQEFDIGLFSLKITNIKNVGTWKYGGYWGVMMVDQNNNPVYCGDYGKNEPIGNSNWKSQESAKVKKALSWGYPNVTSSTSKNDNYARTQLAIWTAQKALNIKSTTLGVYQKVVDAYLNKIAANEKTFSKSLSGSAGIIDKLNMSKAISVNGNAKYKFNQEIITKITNNKVTLYVYQNSSKKYIKVIANKWYAPSQYKNFRLGTSDLSKTVSISNIKIITDLKPISGYIYDNGKSGDQRIFMSVKEPVKTYEVTLNIEKQTGKIIASKQLNKYNKFTYVGGVQFGIYQSEEDAQANKNRISMMTTNDEGQASSIELTPKTYYVKEIKGITNYNMSEVISKVVVKKEVTTKVDGTPNNDSVISFRNTYQLGNVIGYKSLDDRDLYQQIIKDKNNDSIILSNDGKVVVFEDEDYFLEVARYPSKQEMIENDLFDKPIIIKIPEYEYIYEQVIKVDDNDNPLPLLDENKEVILDKNGEPVYEMEEVIKRDDENNPYVKVKRDLQGNILFKDKVLNFNYPTQKEMERIDRINDIEFSLYDSKRKLIKTTKSQDFESQKGIIIFEDLKPGLYYIKESKTLDDLILSNREYHIEIKANQQSFLNEGKEIINIPKAGQLEIKKTNTLNEQLEGVVYAIYEANENGSVNKDKLIDIITTNNQGKAYFNYYAGDYYLEEIIAHPKHKLNNKLVKFSLSNEKLTKLNFENDILLKKINISKVDFLNRKLLSGAKLCLKADHNNYFYLKTKTGKTSKVKEHCWISQDSKYQLKLEPQSYYLKEIKAPQNYERNKELIKFNISTNINKVNHLKITNKLIKGKIEVSKIDITNENELAGAKMCLMKKNKQVFRIYVDNKKRDVKKYCWISTDKPKKMNLYYGKYLIEEVIAPKGYLKIKTMIPFSIDKNGIKKVKVKNEAIKMDLVESGYNLKLVVFLLLTTLLSIISYLLFNRKIGNN